VTRYVITSDVHGHGELLTKVLQSAQLDSTDQWIDLGDVGTDRCYDLLRTRGARLAFGNYEVSQWVQLSALNQRWVQGCSPVIHGPGFLAAHATPCMPQNVTSVEQAWDDMIESNLTWHDLFPRLDRNEDARWDVYTELERRGKQVLFHGHTHVQMGWRIGPTGAMARLSHTTITIDSRGRYIVGVGSVGKPEGASGPQWAIYDDKTLAIELRTLT